MKLKSIVFRELSTVLLRTVRQQESISRVGLARAMDLAPSTIGGHVDRLIQEGCLLEMSGAPSSVGRPPVMLSLNPAAGRFVGVDFDAREIHAVAVDFANRPLQRAMAEIRPGDTPRKIVARLEAIIKEVIPKRKANVLGIGIGVPGLVDPEAGTVCDYRFLTDWNEIPLRDHLQKAFDVPVHLENTARTMTLGESWFGLGRGLRHFVCLVVRTGVAAGVMTDGELIRGSRHAAGELGRWLWPGAGAESKELQDIASARSIRQTLETCGIIDKGATMKEFNAKIAAADERTLSAIQESTDALGSVVAWLANLLNPECVILTGPIFSGAQAFRDEIEKAAKERIHLPPEYFPEIVTSELDDFAGAIGAAGLAVQLWSV